MAVHELDTIAFARDLPEYGLKPGDIGTIVHEYRNSSTVEVEFVTAGGETIAVTTLTLSDIRPIDREEILHIPRMNSEAA